VVVDRLADRFVARSEADMLALAGVFDTNSLASMDLRPLDTRAWVSSDLMPLDTGAWTSMDLKAQGYIRVSDYTLGLRRSTCQRFVGGLTRFLVEA
jgi:hypothetical protein